MSESAKPPFTLLGIRPLSWLLVALPTAFALHWMHIDGVWVFIASCLAIIPLAGLMGRATENLAERLGPGIGGLLNATFGNAAELIIAVLALWKGEVELVKASITGSILGNILLVLGLAILCGGFRYPKQIFNRTAAGLGTTLMALATIGLIVPTIFYSLLPENKRQNNDDLLLLSDEIAGILAFTYVLSLFFTLKTHKHLFAGEEAEGEESIEPEWSSAWSMFVLVIATVGVALMSEMLVGSVEAAAQSLGMNRVFIGVIVVAVIGNAAEHSTAVLMALKNKMDLAVTIAVGSSIQVALFVAPVLLFASLLIDPSKPLDLHFSTLEVVAVVVAMMVMSLVAQDGECHWMEGVLLLAVYVILGLAFYHLPESSAM